MLQARSISKSFGAKKVLESVSFSVTAPERLAVYGPNGVGKSTLLCILAGEDEADSGSVFTPPSEKIGYLPQGYSFGVEMSAADLFSGGQERRQLESEIADLAEKVAHLDIPSREAFEAALERFPGTVLIVSHDRYFIEAYAQRVLAMDHGRLRERFGC